jgi:hypothetical protein
MVITIRSSTKVKEANRLFRGATLDAVIFGIKT